MRGARVYYVPNSGRSEAPSTARVISDVIYASRVSPAPARPHVRVEPAVVVHSREVLRAETVRRYPTPSAKERDSPTVRVVRLTSMSHGGAARGRGAPRVLDTSADSLAGAGPSFRFFHAGRGSPSGSEGDEISSVVSLEGGPGEAEGLRQTLVTTAQALQRARQENEQLAVRVQALEVALEDEEQKCCVGMVALRSEHETLQDRLAAAESALAAARRELQQREEAWAAERAEILSRYEAQSRTMLDRHTTTVSELLAQHRQEVDRLAADCQRERAAQAQLQAEVQALRSHASSAAGSAAMGPAPAAPALPLQRSAPPQWPGHPPPSPTRGPPERQSPAPAPVVVSVPPQASLEATGRATPAPSSAAAHPPSPRVPGPPPPAPPAAGGGRPDPPANVTPPPGAPLQGSPEDHDWELRKHLWHKRQSGQQPYRIPAESPPLQRGPPIGPHPFAPPMRGPPQLHAFPSGPGCPHPYPTPDPRCPPNFVSAPDPSPLLMLHPQPPMRPPPPQPYANVAERFACPPAASPRFPAGLPNGPWPGSGAPRLSGPPAPPWPPNDWRQQWLEEPRPRWPPGPGATPAVNPPPLRGGPSDRDPIAAPAVDTDSLRYSPTTADSLPTMGSTDSTEGSDSWGGPLPDPQATHTRVLR